MSLEVLAYKSALHHSMLYVMPGHICCSRCDLNKPSLLWHSERLQAVDIEMCYLSDTQVHLKHRCQSQKEAVRFPLSTLFQVLSPNLLPAVKGVASEEQINNIFKQH